MPLALRIYRRLLAGYPPRLRARHGPEMLQLCADQLNECSTGMARFRLHCHILADLVRSLPLEHYREYQRRCREAPRIRLRRVLLWALVFAPNPPFAIMFSLGVLGWGLVRKSRVWRQG